MGEVDYRPNLEQKIRETLTRYAPGAVQDSAVRTDLFETTNATFGALTGAGAAFPLIGGAELEAEGTGRPVDILLTAQYRHSTGAAGYVGAYLVVSTDGAPDAVATGLQARAGAHPSGADTTAGTRTGNWLWLNFPTVEGVEYVFKFGVYGPAGTSRLLVAGSPITSQARNH